MTGVRTTVIAGPSFAATTIIGAPGTSGADPIRRIASVRMNVATPISSTALATAVNTSARCQP